MLSRKQLWRKIASPINKKWTKELNIDEIFQQKKTFVSFDTKVNVKLIPEIQEYIDAKLVDNLWYSSDDLEMFKRSRIEELKEEKYATM